MLETACARFACSALIQNPPLFSVQTFLHSHVGKGTAPLLRQYQKRFYNSHSLTKTEDWQLEIHYRPHTLIKYADDIFPLSCPSSSWPNSLCFYLSTSFIDCAENALENVDVERNKTWL